MIHRVYGYDAALRRALWYDAGTQLWFEWLDGDTSIDVFRRLPNGNRLAVHESIRVEAYAVEPDIAFAVAEYLEAHPPVFEDVRRQVEPTTTVELLNGSRLIWQGRSLDELEAELRLGTEARQRVDALRTLLDKAEAERNPVATASGLLRKVLDA